MWEFFRVISFFFQKNAFKFKIRTTSSYPIWFQQRFRKFEMERRCPNVDRRNEDGYRLVARHILSFFNLIKIQSIHSLMANRHTFNMVHKLPCGDISRLRRGAEQKFWQIMWFVATPQKTNPIIEFLQLNWLRGPRKGFRQTFTSTMKIKTSREIPPKTNNLAWYTRR